MKIFRFLLIAVICILAGGRGIALGQCVTPPSGMVAWWPLDETTGPTASDIAGSANNSGTWMNSPTPVNGKVAGALSFNGSNSVDVPDQAELNFGTGDFSIDLWIKTTASSGTHPILDKRTGSVPNLTGYQLYVWNGQPGLQLADGAGYTVLSSTGFVADGNWHHVAVTVDRDNTSGVLFYVDGSLVSILNPTARQLTLTNTAPFVMARNLISPSETFAGSLDELELYNRVLDSLEVRSIWAADSAGKCKPGSLWDVMVTPLRNATLTVVDSTLVVGNIGSSGLDGMDAEKSDHDGDWSIAVANPDPSGTLPVGAWLETQFFFQLGQLRGMSPRMTKAAANTWDLAIQSDTTIYTIKAFNNGSPVFSVVETGTTGLGYIVETAKRVGVYPVGFKGGASSKPGGIVASSDYNFTSSGVQWSWPAHGVSDLQIDYLRISTEVPGTNPLGITHTTMCGANGAKSGPMSFTILDIEVTPAFMWGDANGDKKVTVSDVIYLINYLFKGGPTPVPLEAGDANCDGKTTVSDVVYLINYLFKGGPPPGC